MPRPNDAPTRSLFALLDLDVAEGDRRHAAAQLEPALAAVERRVDPEFGPGEEQVFPDCVLGQRPDDRALGKVSGDRRSTSCPGRRCAGDRA